MVPSGASTGSHEALELRDGGERYGGYGVRDAVRNLNQVLAPAVLGMVWSTVDRSGADAAMEELDGTADFDRLGANAVLALSVALTVAGANGLGRPLWQVLDGGHRPAASYAHGQHCLRRARPSSARHPGCPGRPGRRHQFRTGHRVGLARSFVYCRAPRCRRWVVRPGCR